MTNEERYAQLQIHHLSQEYQILFSAWCKQQEMRWENQCKHALFMQEQAFLEFQKSPNLRFDKLEDRLALLTAQVEHSSMTITHRLDAFKVNEEMKFYHFESPSNKIDCHFDRIESSLKRLDNKLWGLAHLSTGLAFKSEIISLFHHFITII
ncbi:hypothetical protein [Parashewanella tropica]|uniref:hypothetical protein n=1 Tax=Parashewanella tropica TaxID=2547970 RepID=UPI0010593A96|nr:hypothetical protein [Parashewanella tropica]